MVSKRLVCSKEIAKASLCCLTKTGTKTKVDSSALPMTVLPLMTTFSGQFISESEEHHSVVSDGRQCIF